MDLRRDPLYRRFIEDLDGKTWSLESSALDFLNYKLGEMSHRRYAPGLYTDVDKMVVSIVMFWKEAGRIRFRFVLTWARELSDSVTHEKIWTEQMLVASEWPVNRHLEEELKTAVKRLGARCRLTGEIPGTEQLKADYECPCPPCREYQARLNQAILDWEPTGRVSDIAIMMDGSEHGPDCRGSCEDRVCRKCELFMHYQPVYGGYYYECPGCGATFP